MGLVCQNCQYDNDPTRVYCHSCGVRLERSQSAVPPPTGFTHPTEMVTMRRPKKTVPWGKIFFSLIKLGIVAALIASIYLGLQTPKDVPPAVEKNAKLAEQLSNLVVNSAAGEGKRGFGLTADAVNQWLMTVAEFEPRESTIQAQPERIYGVLKDGVIRLGLEVAPPWFGHLYFEADYKPVNEGGQYVLVPVRYSVGQLPIPLVPGWPVKQKFEGFAESLTPLLKNFEKASRIDIKPEKISFQWGQ